ncbi:MAG: hypothetical protein HUU37_07740 [Bdellovibrionales bacterium]|nr:hypothetical protein [Bdellovibrionales bacterium]
MKKVVAGIFVMGLAACSSGPEVREVKVEKEQFKVMEAAPGGREMWLDDAHGFAEESGEGRGYDVSRFFYYSGEGKSASKKLACDKAHSDVIDDVSRGVAVFVDSAVARASTESSSDSTSGTTATSEVNEEVEKISSQLSKASLNGVALKKKYWEKRDYSEAGGAKSIYHCWVMAEVDKKDVESMIQRAKTLRLRSDGDLKKKVADKLDNLDDQYENYIRQH